MTSPKIACIGIIGKYDNPLHIALFPPHSSASSNIEFSLLLNSSLDLFDIRKKHQPVIDQDLGLLHAYDERFAAYGWLTNTGTKFIIIIDMEGDYGDTRGNLSMAAAAGSGGGSGSTGGRSSMDKKSYTAVVGLREADLKPAFRALQTAYIKLMQNPFYSPDNVDPIAKTSMSPSGSTKITNSGFVNEVQKIGEKWRPGVTTF